MADQKISQLPIEGLTGFEKLPLYDLTANQQATAGAVASIGSGAFLDPTTTDYDLVLRKVTAVTTLGVGFIGDSITAGTTVTADPPDIFETAGAIPGVTITANNQGVSGSTSADWVPAAGNYTTAKAAFLSAGVRIVHIMLGTNDSKTAVATSQATYRSNLRSTCDDLVAAGFLVALSYPPFLNTTSGVFDAGSPARVKGYVDAVDSLIDNQHIFRGDTLGYDYFKLNAATALQGDGVHPTQAGSDFMAGLWASAVRPILLGLTKQTVLQRLAIGTGLSISLVGSTYTMTAAAAGAPNIQTVTSSATVTPTFSNDEVQITAQAAGLTLANPTGTAVDGHGVIIRIKDNGTARSISYGSQYRALGVTLPTTTVISKTLYLGMIFNNTDTKWDVVSVAQEA